VDLIVANLGTEHRADAATLQYHGELARDITRRIGPRLCLHGTSSVPPAQVTRLFEDGVRKVNIWTALERDSAPALLADLAGPRTGLWFTTTHRQEIIFHEMKRIVRQFLELWYR
jgi:fructose-bisphosphate aldolase class II